MPRSLRLALIDFAFADSFAHAFAERRQRQRNLLWQTDKERPPGGTHVRVYSEGDLFSSCRNALFK